MPLEKKKHVSTCSYPQLQVNRTDWGSLAKVKQSNLEKKNWIQLPVAEGLGKYMLRTEFRYD